TNFANELIFGADTVFTGNSGAGSTFTSRIITTLDSDLAEDKSVTSAVAYSATAPLTSSGAWVMQMATFALGKSANSSLKVSPAGSGSGTVTSVPSGINRGTVAAE